MKKARDLKRGDTWDGNPLRIVQRVEKRRNVVCVWIGKEGKPTDPMQTFFEDDNVPFTTPTKERD